MCTHKICENCFYDDSVFLFYDIYIISLIFWVDGFLRAISHQRQSLRCDEEVHFQQNLATIICQSVGDVKITSLRYTL